MNREQEGILSPNITWKMLVIYFSCFLPVLFEIVKILRFYQNINMFILSFQKSSTIVVVKFPV